MGKRKNTATRRDDGDEIDIQWPTREEKRRKLDEELSMNPSSVKDRKRRDNMTDAQRAADKERKRKDQAFNRKYKLLFLTEEFRRRNKESQKAYRKQLRAEWEAKEARRRVDSEARPDVLMPDGESLHFGQRFMGTTTEEAQWNDPDGYDTDLDPDDLDDQHHILVMEEHNKNLVTPDSNRAWARQMMGADMETMIFTPPERASDGYSIFNNVNLQETIHLITEEGRWKTVFRFWNTAITSATVKLSALEDMAKDKNIRIGLDVLENYPELDTPKVQAALTRGNVPLPHHVFESAERAVLANMVLWDKGLFPLPGPTWFWCSQKVMNNPEAYYERWGFPSSNPSRTRRQYKQLFQLFNYTRNLKPTGWSFRRVLWDAGCRAPTIPAIVGSCMEAMPGSKFDICEGECSRKVAAQLLQTDNDLIHWFDELKLAGFDLTNEWRARKGQATVSAWKRTSTPKKKVHHARRKESTKEVWFPWRRTKA